MAELIKVEGFDAFKAKLSELTAAGGGDVFVMFSGSKDASGVSWCPDCVSAEPIVSVGTPAHSTPLYNVFCLTEVHGPGSRGLQVSLCRRG